MPLTDKSFLNAPSERRKEVPEKNSRINYVRSHPKIKLDKEKSKLNVNIESSKAVSLEIHYGSDSRLECVNRPHASMANGSLAHCWRNKGHAYVFERAVKNPQTKRKQAAASIHAEISFAVLKVMPSE